MCGRYAASKSPAELIEAYEIDVDASGGQLAADYNVAPTATAPVVLTRRARDPEAMPPVAAPDSPVRQLRALRWGLVPSWAKDTGTCSRMINARMEKAAHSSAFRKPLAARRCLVPADGWFEWRVTGRPGKYGKPGKQPYFMIRADAVPLAFAGLYEFWRDPRVADKNDPAAWWVTYTILTRPAEPGPLAQVHDRMPLVLDPSAWPDWLDPTLDQAAEGAAMMRTAAAVDAGRFRAVPVSPAVGNVANRGPELVAPIDISGQPELALDWPV